MSRWHTIVIVDGTKKLHTFDYVPRIADQDANVAEPRLAWHQRAITDGTPDLTSVAEQNLKVWRPGMSPYEFARIAAHGAGYLSYIPQTFNHVPLEDICEPIMIADSFGPPGKTLAVILNVLRLRDVSSPQPQPTWSVVQLSDLKGVVSKFGGMIGKLDSLSRDKRRRADTALYNAICQQQCAKM